MSDQLLTMRLRAIPGVNNIGLYDDHGTVMALVGTTAITRERKFDTAVRLVACWNACQGLSTESLQRLGTLDRARVSQDVTRDQVVAVLQQALPIIDAYRRLSGGDGDIVAANIRSMLR